MKNCFLTGLVLLLPISLTIWIIVFLMDFLTNPFLEFTESIIPIHQGYRVFLVRILILLFLGALLTLTGFLAQVLLLKFIFSSGDSLLHRIPLINRLYKPIQEIVKTLLNEEKKGFEKVALVHYPHEKAFAIGLIASENIPEGSDEKFSNKISIFIVGAPNPSFGFLVLYDKSKVTYLDLSVEQAMKYLVSCGSFPINFKVADKT